MDSYRDFFEKISKLWYPYSGILLQNRKGEKLSIQETVELDFKIFMLSKKKLDSHSPKERRQCESIYIKSFKMQTNLYNIPEKVN